MIFLKLKRSILMILTSEQEGKLVNLCKKFRKELIECLHAIGSGHPGGSLSATEIITTLYFHELNVNPKNPNDPDRDRFILSKGHAAPMLYLNLAEKGYFDMRELCNLRQLNHMLQGHPCAKTTPGVDLSTGPLGLGVSAAVGMALAGKLDKKKYNVYVLIGDGETQEGIIWEAAMAASKYKLENLIVILDHNKVQLDGTIDEIMPLGNINAKWESFGWKVIETNGHNIRDISSALKEAKQVKVKPTIIIAETVKGKGISFMEGKNIWHGKPIDDEHFNIAMEELSGGN
jgi:transketolase